MHLAVKTTVWFWNIWGMFVKKAKVGKHNYISATPPKNVQKSDSFYANIFCIIYGLHNFLKIVLNRFFK